MNVLLIYQGSDHHAELAREVLVRQGHEITELRLGEPTDFYQVSGTILEPVIETAGGRIDSDVARRSVVLLLMFAANAPAAVSSSKAFVTREWNTLIANAIEIWELNSPRPWLIGQAQLHLRDRKPLLLRTAADLGARIPETELATTPQGLGSPDQWVAKAINVWQEVSPGRYFNTRLLAGEEISRIAGKRFEGPLFLQRYIPHQVEHRVYIAGDAVVGVRIGNPDPTVVDFRLVDHDRAQLELTTPPAEITLLLRRIMSHFGMNYCVFDLAETNEGEWVLFDINSVGSWDYLEKWHGLSLTEAILNGAFSL